MREKTVMRSSFLIISILCCSSNTGCSLSDLFIDKDCTHRDVVQCDEGPSDIDKGYSCHPSTKRCEKKCTTDEECSSTLDGGVPDGGEDVAGLQRCMGGWCRACAPVGEAEPTEIDATLATCYCNNHSQCNSRVCDYSQLSPTGNHGSCQPVIKRVERSNESQRNIIYVGSRGCLSGVMADGSLSNPYCEITQALQRNIFDNQPYVIRVFGRHTPYDGRVLRSDVPSPLWIVGPDQAELTQSITPAILESPVILNGTELKRPFTARLEGVRILNDVYGDDVYGLQCNGPVVTPTSFITPTLDVRRVAIGPISDKSSKMMRSAGALMVNGCKLYMDRVAIKDNRSNALMIKAPTAYYRITNSIIANNDLLSKSPSPAVALNGSGIFRFNTVVNNGDDAVMVPGGIQCPDRDPGAKVVEDSIVFHNRQVGDVQFLRNGMVPCDLGSVVVDSTEKDSSGLLKIDPKFASSFDRAKLNDYFDLSWVRLTADSPCIDKAAGPARDELPESFKYWNWDYDGKRRPQGLYDIGATEYKGKQ